MARVYVSPPAGTPVPHEGEGLHEHEATKSLLRRLADDLTTLLRKELSLAASEVSRSVSETRDSITSVATGGAILFASLIMLMFAAAAALAEVMEPWLAGLIVGVVVGIVGYVMLSRGRKKLKAASLKPQRIQEELRHDREMLSRRMQ